MGKQKPKKRLVGRRVQPEGDDRLRMHRLYEEVTSRLQEMSMILTRVWSENDPDVAAVLARSGLQSIEIVYPTTKTRMLVMGELKIILSGCGEGMCLCENANTMSSYVC
jgi:hypothetical protein